MSINVNNNSLLAIKYPLKSFIVQTKYIYMVHRPTVQEGQWVEKGDILADNSSSQQEN
jgi:multidrug efflux pump subunit AcrA (membrane-fusion protein)